MHKFITHFQCLHSSYEIIFGDRCADLFNWALKTDVITADQARRCAKRGTGRPWEAVWNQVYSLGVYPDKWPVPLQRQGVLAFCI